jgi:hypothetical protein
MGVFSLHFRWVQFPLLEHRDLPEVGPALRPKEKGQPLRLAPETPYLCLEREPRTQLDKARVREVPNGSYAAEPGTGHVTTRVREVGVIEYG